MDGNSVNGDLPLVEYHCWKCKDTGRTQCKRLITCTTCKKLSAADGEELDCDDNEMVKCLECR